MRTYSGDVNSTEDPFDGQTTSFYINDNWTLNDKWSVNIGIRFDQSIASDTTGERVNSLDFNPRLRLQHDLFGDNMHVFALAMTQQVGNLYKYSMGAFASTSTAPVNRKYIWDKDLTNTTGDLQFVTTDQIMDQANWGRYWSLTDSRLNYQIDPNLKPEQNTNFELSYRRAFPQGGYFRTSLIYNLLTRALYAEWRDEAVKVVDPGPTQPQNAAADLPLAYLYNRDDRGRHYASAEMEWMMPLGTKATWRLNWYGN
jgi:outer membrane receptor for ferrienterochelin and colicin